MSENVNAGGNGGKKNGNNNNYRGKRRNNYNGRKNYDKKRKNYDGKPSNEGEGGNGNKEQKNNNNNRDNNNKGGGQKKYRNDRDKNRPKKNTPSKPIVKAEETLEDIKSDNARITKEIYLEIADIKNIKIG